MSAEFAVTEDYQAKILAYMLHNSEFCGIASDHLNEELFTNRALQWFFKCISSSKSQLTPVLLREELLKAAKNKEIKEEEIGKYIETYDLVKAKPLPSEEEYIQEKMSAFIRTQEVRNAMVDIVPLAKDQKWGEIGDLMQEAISAGASFTDLGHDYFGEVEERLETRANQEVARKIPTGIPELDDITYGGIKNRQTGLIVGGTGRGKSIFLQWLGRTAVMLNKKVVYFTFELQEDEIAARYDSMFSQVRPQELREYQAKVLDEVSKIGSTFGSSLIIKHYPTDTATVGTLKAFMKTLRNSGIVPDLVLIDYLDLLRPHRNYGSPHEEIDAITKAVVGFAQEYDVAVYTATQMNRSGLTMETPDEASIAGYVGKTYHADMVWWMAQTPDEREDEKMRIWVSKNRNGISPRTVKLDTNYSYMEFYRENNVQEEGSNDEPNNKTEDEPDLGRDLQLLLDNSSEGHSTDSESD